MAGHDLAALSTMLLEYNNNVILKTTKMNTVFSNYETRKEMGKFRTCKCI